MSFPPSWHPVVAAAQLRAGDNVVAVLVQDQPLALWRSADGAARAWEDRCPHRGVALSLGRVEGDYLSCAYHGWQYAATNGRCIAIPAMPHQPVPGKVCVRTYAVREFQEMVWVGPAAVAPRGSAPEQEITMDEQASTQEPAPHAPTPTQVTRTDSFLRSLCVDRPVAWVAQALAAAGFSQPAPHSWHGTLDGAAVHLYCLAASTQWCMLHLFAAQRPDDTQRKRLFASAHALRAAIEAPQER